LSRTRGGTLVLYGAGTVGRRVLAGLRSGGLEPAAFVDDTPEKQGSMLDGIPVEPPGAILPGLAADASVAVTMLNPKLPFPLARRRLAELTDARIQSLYDLARELPGLLLPLGPIATTEWLDGQGERIEAAARLFGGDPASATEFRAHVRFQAELDFHALPELSHPAYFCAEVLALLPERFRFVDCGAYDGDTLRDLLATRSEGLERVVAFEPDPDSCRRLAEYARGLPPAIASRVDVRCRAVGERSGRASFAALGTSASTLDPSGASTVEVVTLDEAVPAEGARLYVKLDVEGAEREALRGAERLIQAAKPILAVSVYHRPGDLWEVPLQLDSLDAAYGFLLRTHGHDGTEVVCYAVPEEVRRGASSAL
jgi:FkbM family methyltransferase